MSDLIQSYERSGLISDPTKCFRFCEWCQEKFHPDELEEVDVVDRAGVRETILVCEPCLNPDESEL